jgi:hypothetical protein
MNCTDFFMRTAAPGALRTVLRALTACALAGTLALPALADSTGTVKYPGAELHVTASMSAAAIDKGAPGDRVEYVARDGLFWRKVRLRGQEGWMLRTAITWDDDGAAPAAPAAAAAPASPVTATPAQPVQAAPATMPAAPPAVAVATAPAAAAATRSRGRAVVFGVSQYRRPGTSDLPGVPRDMDSAKAMAMLMGVTPDRVSIYRDAEVTHDAIAATLTQLAKEVTEGDPVLVYFSGHGSRMEFPSGSGRCVEGLLTADGRLFTAEEMSAVIQPLARITDGLFVFFDACHTGNLTASRATGPPRLQAQVAPRAVGAGPTATRSSTCSSLHRPAAAPQATATSTRRPRAPTKPLRTMENAVAWPLPTSSTAWSAATAARWTPYAPVRSKASTCA